MQTRNKNLVMDCTGSFFDVLGPQELKTRAHRMSNNILVTVPTLPIPRSLGHPFFRFDCFCHHTPPDSHRVYPDTKRCLFTKISSTVSPLEIPSFFENVVGPTKHNWELSGSGWFCPFQIKVPSGSCLRPSMTRLRGTSRPGDA